MKTSLFRTCSNKVTLTFHKHFENTRKKGGAAPSAPPLNPPMKSVVRKDRHTWDEKSQTSRTSRHFGYTQNQVYLIDWEFETNSLRMFRNLDLPRSRYSWCRPKGAPLLGTRIIPKKNKQKIKRMNFQDQNTGHVRLKIIFTRTCPLLPVKNDFP